ncbi:MAG: FAD-dependent oxidoreductase [Gammaproteobacteria bacterium]|nr:MAG: FAD-dependent oxidoreductase [Gammaproteobacteria bacterium]
MKPQIVAIIGAGPVGLAAGAQALERGLTPIIFEQGAEVAHAIRQWQHVKMFSPWEFNIDTAAEKLLNDAGWHRPDDNELPTGGELVERYIAPLGTQTILKQYVKLSAKVTAISRVGLDKLMTAGREEAKFEIRYTQDDQQQVALADAVIDISGTWSTPNPAGSNGLPAFGEPEAAEHISYVMPDVLGRKREQFANKRVAVLGGGHSAVGTILDLVTLREEAPDTDITWLVRGEDTGRSFGGGDNDQIEARGALGTKFKHLIEGGKIRIESGFYLSHIARQSNGLKISSSAIEEDKYVTVDELVVSTGFRPDYSFASELRLELDPATECPPILAPMIDPNVHSCGTVRPHGARELAQPEKGFYIAGMKSYGRAPTFLMITGYEQVRSIIADIVGDKEGAARVELVLPETGVCSAPLDNDNDNDNEEGCCAPTSQQSEENKAGCCSD